MNSVRFFERLYGKKLIWGALAIGIGIYVSALIGNARLDGVLSLHFVSKVSPATLLGDMLINLLSLFLFFGAALYSITRRIPRLVDLIPQLIWAQWPLIPLSLLSFLFDFQQLQSLSQDQPLGTESLDMLSSGSFWFSTLALIAGIIFEVHFLFGLFKVDSGLKGAKLNWYFALSLILSMTLSIYLVTILN